MEEEEGGGDDGDGDRQEHVDVDLEAGRQAIVDHGVDHMAVIFYKYGVRLIAFEKEDYKLCTVIGGLQFENMLKRRLVDVLKVVIRRWF